jgi:hypothetical protein
VTVSLCVCVRVCVCVCARACVWIFFRLISFFFILLSSTDSARLTDPTHKQTDIPHRHTPRMETKIVIHLPQP